MSELTVRGLRKEFAGQQVLRGLDLDVDKGSFVTVLGPSGCGKTTLLRIVAGFERPDGGTVSIDGREVAGPGLSVAPERRRVGVVPQEGALFPHLSVARNVGYGLSRAERRGRRVDEVLEMVGLPGLGGAMPHELSGGMQQRVAVARALAPSPSLVLLDEPFSALDAGLRADVRDDVRTALKAAGATAVLVTHDQTEALSIADLVAVVRDGVVVQAGSPSDVYDAPADLAVATFVGEAVVLPGDMSQGGVVTALGQLSVRPGPGRHLTGSVTTVIRPEQIVVEPAGDGARATVVDEVFMGHDTLSRLRLADSTLVAARTLGRFHAAPGDAVRLSVSGEVSVFPGTQRPAPDSLALSATAARPTYPA